MIGNKPGQREPGFLRRWWTVVTKGRHSAYVMVDAEKYSVQLPKGAIVRECGILPTGTLVMALDMTFAKGYISFSMANKAHPSPAPEKAPPTFVQHGPVDKQ